MSEYCKNCKEMADRLAEYESKLPQVPRVVMGACPTCKGKGSNNRHHSENGEPTCFTCSGDGKVPVRCEVCVETGRFAGHDIPESDVCCSGCDGHGYKTEMVPVVPGMEVWAWRFGNCGKNYLYNFYAYSVTGGRVCDGDRLSVDRKNLYADEATAKILGGAR